MIRRFVGCVSGCRAADQSPGRRRLIEVTDFVRLSASRLLASSGPSPRDAGGSHFPPHPLFCVAVPCDVWQLGEWELNFVRICALIFLKGKGGGVRPCDDRRQERMMVMKSDSPLRTIKFRPLPRSRKTERVRPLKTIHIAPPPRGAKRPLKTIHITPPPRPST